MILKLPASFRIVGNYKEVTDKDDVVFSFEKFGSELEVV